MRQNLAWRIPVLCTAHFGEKFWYSLSREKMVIHKTNMQILRVTNLIGSRSGSN